MRTVFLDFATVSHEDVSADPLRIPGIELMLHDVTPASAVAERCRNAGIVIVNKVNLDATVLESAAELRLVCLAATGTNNVDIDAARRRNVAVCNIEAYCTASVVQHVFAVILSLTHHLQGYQALLRAGAWRDSPQFCLPMPQNPVTPRAFFQTTLKTANPQALVEPKTQDLYEGRGSV